MHNSDKQTRLFNWFSLNGVKLQRINNSFFRVEWLSVYDETKLFSVTAEGLTSALEKAETVYTEEIDSYGKLPHWASDLLD